jgi:hypothetical protein
LPAFFFPPLAFFAIVFYPPLHVGFLRERSRHHSWLPPGTLTRCRRPSLQGTSLCSFEHRKGELDQVGRASLGMA